MHPPYDHPLPPPGQPYTTAYCRICFLYHRNPRFRAFWDGQPPPPPPQPIPEKDWPVWVKGVAKLRQEGEIGVGDTVHRLLTTLGVAWFWQQFMVKMLGNCNCEARRVALNARHPYPP